MKKIAFMCMLTLLSTVVIAQGFPKAEVSVKEWAEIGGGDIWYKDDDGAIYKLRGLNPVSINETIDDCKKLLKVIGADYSNPTGDKSFFYNNETEFDMKTFYLNSKLKYSTLHKFWTGYYQGKKYIVIIYTGGEKGFIGVGYDEIKP